MLLLSLHLSINKIPSSFFLLLQHFFAIFHFSIPFSLRLSEMSELSYSQCHYSTLLISNLIRLSSFVLYFVFFPPFLLKLISFLSPIILTASLVFLAGFVFTASSSKLHFPSILERFHFKKLDSHNEELHRSDDLGMCEIVFGPPSTAAVMRENDPPELFPQQDPGVGNKYCVVMASNVEEMKKKPEPTNGAKSDKVVEKQKPLLMNGSEAAACNNNNESSVVAAKLNLEECSPKAKSQSQDHHDGDDEKLKLRALDRKSEGSMRREREWERTLACKLFEERRDVGGGGGEGMDSLWEAYEMEEDSASEKVRKEKTREEEDEEIGGQVCCLQALKLSAGKMILGVGKPNFVKISKAIKGVGWLHKTTKHSKKVHNHGGDHRY